MTPSQRAKAFRRARLDVLKLRTELQRGSAGEITKLLKTALAEIRALLAAQPSDYQRWYLPQLKASIEQVLDEFERGAARSVSGAAGRAFEAGQALVDAPLEAGGVRVSAMLPQVDTRQLQAMRTFMVDRIADISTTVANKIAGDLSLVVIGAQSPGDAISRIAGIVEGGRGRAITIVRTEVGRAFSTAANERMQQASEMLPGLKKQWRRSGKINSRLEHDLIDGQIQPVDQPFVLGNGTRIMYPRDPAAPAKETINCFLPGTVIGGRVLGAMRARYSGQALRLRTARGLRLAVTPNHPVLTPRGFRAAQMLRKGDDLLGHRGDVEEHRARSAAVEVDKENGPAAIEEVFRAFAKAGAFRRAGARDDFHGDGRLLHGDVEVVGATGELLAAIETARLQLAVQCVLELAAMREPARARQRAALLAGGGIARAFASAPGVLQLALDGVLPVRLDRAPLDALRLGDAAQLDARRRKVLAEDVTADAAFVAELLERFPGAVLPDEVIEVREFHYAGFVYDVQSPFGWIVANGVFASNCGCESLPYMESWDVQTPGRRAFSEDELARNPTKRDLRRAGFDQAA